MCVDTTQGDRLLVKTTLYVGQHFLITPQDAN